MKKDDLLPEEKATDKAPDDDNEIQDLYDIYFARALEPLPGVIGNINGSSSPVVIAEAILNVMIKVESDGEKDGIRYPLEVAAAAGRDILLAMVKAGVIQPDENMRNEVIGLVVGHYINGKVNSGKMPKEVLKKIAQGDQQQAAGPQPPQQQQPPQMMQQGGMPNG